MITDAKILVGMLLEGVRAKIVPEHMPTERFDEVVAALRPSLEDAWAGRLARLPWGGWVTRDERDGWKGRAVRHAEHGGGVVVELLRGGGKARVSFGGTVRTVFSAELVLDHPTKKRIPGTREVWADLAGWLRGWQVLVDRYETAQKSRSKKGVTAARLNAAQFLDDLAQTPQAIQAAELADLKALDRLLWGLKSRSGKTALFGKLGAGKGGVVATARSTGLPEPLIEQVAKNRRILGDATMLRIGTITAAANDAGPATGAAASEHASPARTGDPPAADPEPAITREAVLAEYKTLRDQYVQGEGGSFEYYTRSLRRLRPKALAAKMKRSEMEELGIPFYPATLTLTALRSAPYGSGPRPPRVFHVEGTDGMVIGTAFVREFHEKTGPSSEDVVLQVIPEDETGPFKIDDWIYSLVDVGLPIRDGGFTPDWAKGVLHHAIPCREEAIPVLADPTRVPCSAAFIQSALAEGVKRDEGFASSRTTEELSHALGRVILALYQQDKRAHAELYRRWSDEREFQASILARVRKLVMPDKSAEEESFKKGDRGVLLGRAPGAVPLLAQVTSLKNRRATLRLRPGVVLGLPAREVVLTPLPSAEDPGEAHALVAPTQGGWPWEELHGLAAARRLADTRPDRDLILGEISRGTREILDELDSPVYGKRKLAELVLASSIKPYEKELSVTDYGVALFVREHVQAVSGRIVDEAKVRVEAQAVIDKMLGAGLLRPFLVPKHDLASHVVRYRPIDDVTASKIRAELQPAIDALNDRIVAAEEADYGRKMRAGFAAEEREARREKKNQQ